MARRVFLTCRFGIIKSRAGVAGTLKHFILSVCETGFARYANKIGFTNSGESQTLKLPNWRPFYRKDSGETVKGTAFMEF